MIIKSLLTFSQAEGEYYFEEVPIHITKSVPLLAEITIDTINEYTGLPVDKAYKMKSYIGCTNVITPYTSMIQHLIEQQYSIEEAERKVKHKSNDGFTSMFRLHQPRQQ